MDDIQKMRTVLVVGVVLIVASIGSCSELRYAANSDTAEAVISRVIEHDARRIRRGRQSAQVTYEYQFTDADGETRNGYDRVNARFEPVFVVNDKGRERVMVQYRPGTDVSRLVGTEQWYLLWILAAAVLISIGATVWFLIDYNRHQKAMAASSSR